MMTYVINLKRSEERRIYIENHLKKLSVNYKLIDAIDGNLLTDEEFKMYCDSEYVKKSPNWLTKGALGCALSHKKAMETLLSSNDEYAFIIEDDLVLPHDIVEIIHEVEKKISPNDFVSLFYSSGRPTKISSTFGIQLSKYNLYFPMEMHCIGSAVAYIIGRNAALKVSQNIIPLRAAVDTWNYFYNKDCFSNFYLLYPQLVDVTHVKSSINYHQNKKLYQFVSELIDKYKIPILYHYLKSTRRKTIHKRLNNFTLTKDKSPHCKKLA